MFRNISAAGRVFVIISSAVVHRVQVIRMHRAGCFALALAFAPAAFADGKAAPAKVTPAVSVDVVDEGRPVADIISRVKHERDRVAAEHAKDATDERANRREERRERARERREAHRR
jgi:hypothetical protein